MPDDDELGRPQPSRPVYGDAPLPGAQAPTRWTLLRGAKITVGLFLVAGLILAGSGVLVVLYVENTNDRITALERYLVQRRQVGEERDAATRRLITAQREVDRREKCAILSRIPQGQDRSADTFRRALRCGPPAVGRTPTPSTAPSPTSVPAPTRRP